MPLGRSIVFGSVHPKSNANYAIAYDSLVKRYDNKRLLSASYWNAFDNAPKLTDALSNSKALRNLINTFIENRAALQHLGHLVNQWDFVFFNMFLKRLNTETVTRFELEHSCEETPLFDTLIEFVTKQCDAFDSASFINSPQMKPHDTSKPPSHSGISRHGVSFLVRTANSCALCQEEHLIYKCPAFLTKSVQDRYKVVKDHKWCVNCLGDKHQIKSCSSMSTCRTCGQKQHSLLHFNSEVVQRTTPNSSGSSASSQNVHSLTSFTNNSSTVMLLTAVIDFLDQQGIAHPVRVLLDSASQANFVSEKCANRLGFTRNKLSFSIHGLGDMQAGASQGINCRIQPRNLTSPQYNIEAVVLPQVCGNMRSTNFFRSSWPHIANIKLADPHFNISSNIDMLLAADIFAMIIKTGRRVGNDHEPTAYNTEFGWILMGPINLNNPVPSSNVISFCTTTQALSLDSLVQKFWELEEILNFMKMSILKEPAEQLFVSQHLRDRTSRFVVPLPFRFVKPEFSDSRPIAYRQFLLLEQRLTNNFDLYQQYKSFMQEYLDLEHMELIKNSTEFFCSYYIPHHCVIKPDSISTKLRVVFDASAKTSEGVSLNDTLYTGPKKR